MVLELGKYKVRNLKCYYLNLAGTPIYFSCCQMFINFFRPIRTIAMYESSGCQYLSVLYMYMM